MLAKAKVAIVMTATKIAVQAPCEETALSPIEALSIADADTKISSGRRWVSESA